MKKYAEVFNRTSHSGIKRNIIICNDVHSDWVNSNCVEIVSIPDCDYHKFHSKKSFLTLKNRLLRKLEDIITNQDLPRPVCIVGHNLSLGKNLAISAAFAELANNCTSEDNIRFYSVIHDMAEEGRTHLMSRIRHMESIGIPVWNNLYPQMRNLKYVVINSRNYNLFRDARFSVSLLPNPLDSVKLSRGLSKLEYNRIEYGLSQISQKDNTAFNTSAKTFFYPVRVISRKNILEAIIIACLMNKANLLVGGCETSKHDSDLFKRIKQISRRYNLPVVLDVERLREYLPKWLLKKSCVFGLIYNYSDICITTSIAEGFGYALYEPWLYGKKVMGRLPHGISPSELINSSHLYSRFDIPVEWLSIAELEQEYYSQIKRTFGADNTLCQKADFNKIFRKSFIHNGCIDFGALNQEMQFTILENLCLYKNGAAIKPNSLKDIASISENCAQIFNGENLSYIEENRRILKKNLVGRSFDKSFKACFYKPFSFTKKNDLERGFLTRYFSSLDVFRLLMTPGC